MKSVNERNLLITGCAGFIGSHAAEYFIDHGYNVFGVDCLTYAGNTENMRGFVNNIPVYRHSICETNLIKKIVEKHNIDWIINFAAETHVDNSINSCDPFIESNINGVKSLLEVCRDTKTKIFHISTDEVYGVALNEAYTEEANLSPRNPYSATKAAAEHLVTAYANTYGVEYLMVRPSNNFGPRQHDEKLLPTVVRSISLGDKVPIYGDGKNIREWTYVKDTASAIRFILENSPLNEVYNVSTSFSAENLEVITEVCDLMKVDFNSSVKFITDRPGHDFKYSISGDKLATLGFVLDDQFKHHLSETVKFFKNKYYEQ